MVIDTSALIAIISGEPEQKALNELIADAEDAVISAATLLEANIVAEARSGPKGPDLIAQVLSVSATRVVAVDETQAAIAHRAWRTYGKGRHPAGLNYGDCFSYALAKATGKPLLFKGNDFNQTDIAAAA